MSKVQIRPIRGFPGYPVGTDGSVWTKWGTRGRVGRRGVESYIGETMRPLKLGPHGSAKKYLSVFLRKEGRYYPFLVHRLVLETFVGPCPDGMQCLHRDDDGRNNRLSNLRWGTPKENHADKVRHGTHRLATEAAARANRGRPRPPEVRKKIGDAQRGRRHSPEMIAKLTAAHWSRGPNAAEIGRRISATKRGEN